MVTISSITNGMAWEFANITEASLRVGHMVDVGATWPTLVDFNNMMETIESVYGTRATDIQKYSAWREEIAATPIFPVSASFSLASPLSGTIIAPTEVNWTYSIYHTTDFCFWKELQRIRSPREGQIRIPVQIQRGRHEFWKIIKFQERRQQ